MVDAAQSKKVVLDDGTIVGDTSAGAQELAKAIQRMHIFEVWPMSLRR